MAILRSRGQHNGTQGNYTTMIVLGIIISAVGGVFLLAGVILYATSNFTSGFYTHEEHMRYIAGRSLLGFGAILLMIGLVFTVYGRKRRMYAASRVATTSVVVSSHQHPVNVAQVPPTYPYPAPGMGPGGQAAWPQQPQQPPPYGQGYGPPPNYQAGPPPPHMYGPPQGQAQPPPAYPPPPAAPIDPAYPGTGPPPSSIQPAVPNAPPPGYDDSHSKY